MPYQTPHTFSDGAVLSAAHLNIFSDNLEYFYGLASSVNVPFALVSTGVDASPWNYKMLHLHRYLNIFLTVNLHIAQITGSFTVTYNGLTVKTVDFFADSPVSGDPNATYNYWVAIDLDAAPGPFTVGTYYDVSLIPASTGPGFEPLAVSNMYESDTAAS